jgi:hypothetical protein
MGAEPDQRILDVGGQRSTWRDVPLTWSVTVLNLNGPDAAGRCGWIRGDALRAPFADGAFDIVFSNSVIEHVGDREDQRRFASEIQRIGHRYWVQAPNRYFPIEPHFLFPCFQFLPLRARLVVAAHWPFSWDKHFGVSAAESQENARRIRLPTAAELVDFFPGGALWREQVLGLTKSLTICSPG